MEDELYKLDIKEFPIYHKGQKVTLTIRCTYESMPRHKTHDVDSLAAPVLDALTGLAYEDDSQVHRLCVEKAQGQEERIQIYLSNLEKWLMTWTN